MLYIHCAIGANWWRTVNGRVEIVQEAVKLGEVECGEEFIDADFAEPGPLGQKNRPQVNRSHRRIEDSPDHTSARVAMVLHLQRVPIQERRENFQRDNHRVLDDCAFGGVNPPRLAGTWVLDPSQSKSDFPAVARISVEQTSCRVRLTQSDKDGRTGHSLQGGALIFPPGGPTPGMEKTVLLISDDGAGRSWKVSYKGDKPAR